SVALLYAQGTLRGRFDTNDRFTSVPEWCVRGEHYCGRDGMNYFLLGPYPLPQDPPRVADPRADLARRVGPWGVAPSSDHAHPEIFAQRDRVAAEMEGSPRIFREEDFVDFYYENLLDPFTRNGPLGSQPIPNPSTHRFGEQIYLVGHE